MSISACHSPINSSTKTTFKIKKMTKKQRKKLKEMSSPRKYTEEAEPSAEQ